MKKIASGAEIMSTILSFTEALEEMYEHMHWRASGPNYYGDHLLYQRLYEDIEGEIDGIAEKAVGVFGPDSIGPNKNISETAKITEKLISDTDTAEKFPEIAISAEEKFVELVSRALKEMDKSNELTNGIDNMLQGVVDSHEGHLYLLKQRANKKESSTVIRLFKLAYYLDRKSLYNEAREIEEVMLQLAKRVGINQEEMVSLADELDQIGDTVVADKIDNMIKSNK